MFGFGGKKDDDEKKEKEEQEQVSQAMRSMSDQLGQQAQEIKRLQEQLAASQKEATAGDAAERALAQAQARLKTMQGEMDKLKTNASKAAAGAATGAAAATGGVVGARPASGGASKLGGVTPTPEPMKTPESAPGAPEAAMPEAASGLRIGSTAFVRRTGGKNLRLRNGPGLNTNAFDGLAPGTSMTLLEGPFEKDDYPWYRIRTVDGREGWVAGTELVTQPD